MYSSPLAFTSCHYNALALAFQESALGTIKSQVGTKKIISQFPSLGIPATLTSCPYRLLKTTFDCFQPSSGLSRSCSRPMPTSSPPAAPTRTRTRSPTFPVTTTMTSHVHEHYWAFFVTAPRTSLEGLQSIVTALPCTEHKREVLHSHLHD